MPGIVVSKKAGRVLDFLERTGPAPFDAIAIATGLSRGDLNRALNILRGSGYSSPCRIRGIEFWLINECSSNGFDPSKQEALTWFVARLEEAGGHYQAGVARYPKGIETSIELKGSVVQTGELASRLEDLKVKPLRKCLYKTG